MQWLDFGLLDDLALAVDRRGAQTQTALSNVAVRRIGPLIELFVAARASDRWTTQAIKPCSLLNALRATLEKGSAHVLEGGEPDAGFILTCRDPMKEESPEWTAFCYQAQRAAQSCGMPAVQARGLVGAMREIEENVHLHSGRPSDGIVGFRASKEDFEFVVADSGVGALSSLKQSPDYRDLKDAGTAIRLALTDGESRLRYKEKGRGYGFHDLFVGLANLNGHLRFRSDDHALTIDGSSPSLLTARLRQTAHLQGFVASVICSNQGVAQVH